MGHRLAVGDYRGLTGGEAQVAGQELGVGGVDGAAFGEVGCGQVIRLADRAAHGRRQKLGVGRIHHAVAVDVAGHKKPQGIAAARHGGYRRRSRAIPALPG